MKCTFASYQHSRLGFPRVILKWNEDDGQTGPAYVTIHGVIQPGNWAWHNQYPTKGATMAFELERFNKWVAERFSGDASVQG